MGGEGSGKLDKAGHWYWATMVTSCELTSLFYIHILPDSIFSLSIFTSCWHITYRIICKIYKIKSKSLLSKHDKIASTRVLFICFYFFIIHEVSFIIWKGSLFSFAQNSRIKMVSHLPQFSIWRYLPNMRSLNKFMQNRPTLKVNFIALINILITQYYNCILFIACFKHNIWDFKH